MITRPQTDFDLGQNVRRQQNRVSLAQLADQGPDFPDLKRVQPGGRLVQDEDFGVVHHGFGQADPLAKPARELADDPILDLPELTTAHHLADGSSPLRPGNILELRAKPQIFLHSHLVIERHVLRQVADDAPDLQRLVERVVTGQGRATAGGCQICRQHPHRRGLAGPVGPEQTDDFASPHFEADPIHRLERTESLREPVHLDHLLTHEPTHHLASRQYKYGSNDRTSVPVSLTPTAKRLPTAYWRSTINHPD